MRKITKLRDDIMTLRVNAAAIYDKEIVSGAKPEDITKKIEPLVKAMEHLIEKAVIEDLGSCVAAIEAFDNEAKAHRNTAKFFFEKAAESETHAQEVRQKIVLHMKKLGKTEMVQGDYFANFVEKDGKVILNVR